MHDIFQLFFFTWASINKTAYQEASRSTALTTRWTPATVGSPWSWPTTPRGSTWPGPQTGARPSGYVSKAVVLPFFVFTGRDPVQASIMFLTKKELSISHTHIYKLATYCKTSLTFWRPFFPSLVKCKKLFGYVSKIFVS